MAGTSSPGIAGKIKTNILKLCESDHNKKADEPVEPNKPISNTSPEPPSMASTLTKVKVSRNPNYKNHGTKSYVYAMSRYGFNPTMEGPYKHHKHVHQQGKFGEQKAVGGKARLTTQLVRAAADGTSGQVSSEDIQNDSLYLTPVTIGTPGKTFNLDFDTGSSDLWLWSTELPSSTRNSANGRAHTIFNPTESSTYKKSSGSTWQISYGDGSSASGDVGTDNVTIGGLTVRNQSIELAKELSSAFQQDTGDGLLGLAWGSINTVQPRPVSTPVESMIAQNDIPKNAELFTAYLGSWRDTADADKGESFYTFGFIDNDLVTTSGQEVSYTPVDNSQGFWQIASASYTINGQTYRQANNTSIMDTGTTLALVSDEVCQNVYGAIPGSTYDNQQQGWTFPSNTSASDLPVVTFAIGEKQFTVAKEDLGFADAGNGMVYGGIQSRGDQSFDIYGDVVLKNIYAIFDVGNTRFGAIQRTEGSQNLSAPPATS